MNEFDSAKFLASTDDETLKYLWFLSRKETFTLIRATEKVLKVATSDAGITTNPKALQMAVDYCRYTITAARRWLRLNATPNKKLRRNALRKRAVKTGKSYKNRTRSLFPLDFLA